MASTALNSRLLEAMVTSRPETVTSTSPVNGQDVPTSYIAQYTATLEDFARRNGSLMDASLSGGEVTTEDEEGSYDEANGGQKRSASSPLDSAKKRRKQSKPNKIGGGSDCSGDGEDMEKEEGRVRTPETSNEPMADGEVIHDHSRIENSPVRCPHCEVTSTNHEELRRHIIEQHIGRIFSEEELMARQAHFARQKLLEQQQQQNQQQIQQYQQKLMNDAIRMQEQQKRDAIMEQEQMIKQNERVNQESKQQQQSSQNHQNLMEREEGETGPLNLSRWDPHTSHAQDPQRSPVTPLPASIPMPPSFPDARFNLPGILPFGPPPFFLPFMQQNDREPGLTSSGQQNNFSPGGSRIFNLEAFCDLCNKEFCNKYFLKTHKANKHGIFTDEPNCSPMPPTPPTPIGPSTPLGPNAQLMTPLVHSPMTPTSINGSPYAGAFLAANLGNIPIRPPLPVSLHSNVKSPANNIKSETTLNKSGVINLDAYCELCQKEFCNKYFLKRHKLKIHGVNIEVTIKSPKTNPALERPEGWCDACRRDIGSRTALNAHKLNVHGPHIVNNIPNADLSPRHPLDFRQLNSLPIKLNNPERDQKQNFSPWDIIREREAMENQAAWKEAEKRRNSSEHPNKDHLNGDQSATDKEMKEDMFAEEKSPHASFSLQSVMAQSDSKNNLQSDRNEAPSLSSQFSDIRKIKLSQSNIINEENNLFVKKEEKLQSEEATNGNKIKHDGEIEPPMPILKPHTESHNEAICSKANNSSLEERPPLLTKEHSAPDDDNNDTGVNITEPPRTPGGVSNSTDDSSREAGIIARVGQPAIVQAPPGTKFTPEQLRQLGVINPDAFCELCCKEFCNKYFLRTHRLKKHNIYTPEYSERSKQQYKDAAPINLAKIFERQAFEYRPPVMNQVDLKLDCDICRRQFPNPYLLHMHKYYFHGPGQDSPQENHSLAEPLIPNEHLRQFALQAHHQKMQDHQQFLIRHQKQLQEDNQNRMTMSQQEQEKSKENEFCSDLIKDVKAEDDNQGEKQMDFNGLQNNDNLKSHSSEESDNIVKDDASLRTAKSPAISPGAPEHRNASNGSANGEADTSEELRKLQSMILELNRQGDDSVTCKVCQKEIGNKYFLRAHMMTEHAMFLQDELHNNSENAQTPKTPYDSSGRVCSPVNPSGSDSQSYCDICKKDFFSRYILQQHMLTSHGIFTQHSGSTSFLDRIRAEVEGREDRKPQSVSRSFCDICNKELCNKYFMKTHMLKMHGINIENGSSGGVTCDLCNKELCSKYFLKVHRQNTHGLVEDIRDSKDTKDGIIRERREGEEMSDSDMTSVETCTMCNRKFKNIKWLRTHLTQDHGDEGKAKWREIEATLPPLDLLARNSPSCSICGQVQPDVVSLQLHVIKHHGAKTQNEDQSNDSTEQTLHCSSCSFMCRSPALLAAHERSHTPLLPLTPQITLPGSPLQCQVCPQVLPSIETYQQHLLGHQLQGLFEPLLTKNNENLMTGRNFDEESSKNNDQCMNKDGELQSQNAPRKFWRCRRCCKRYKSRNECLLHMFTKHLKRPSNSLPNFQTWRRKTFKCRKCGISERRLGDLLDHIRIHYPSSDNNKRKQSSNLPVATIAQPLETESDLQFVMQPFLMNKQVTENSTEDDVENDFAPSLVHLPVCRRVMRPINVSFTLTPA